MQPLHSKLSYILNQFDLELTKTWLTIISLFLARNCVLNGPEILNLSAIFLVASLTCEANGKNLHKTTRQTHLYKKKYNLFLLDSQT